jgi:TonB family protein
MQNHIRKHFNYPAEAVEQGIEGQVNIFFTIDEMGNVVDIKKRGPHELLENEADRIIRRLPQMKPGILKGSDVKVYYSIPIIFRLQ